MKKIKEPNPQVIKFESIDVIATSTPVPKEQIGGTFMTAKGKKISGWGY